MSNVLLITVGFSPMIVTEVVLGYGVKFDEVHIFTTDNSKLPLFVEELENTFNEYFPTIQLTVTASKDIDIVNTSESQKKFTEALFQWYLEKSNHRIPYTCISGGTKTIPATMQQAARYFGAKDVFHLLAEVKPADNPKNYQEVIQLIEKGLLSFVSMGEEAGWNSLKHLFSFDHFSVTTKDENHSSLYWKQTDSQLKLSENIGHIMQLVKNSATGDDTTAVPFASLRLLPLDIYSWLSEPVNTNTDKNWIKSLPKVDLHCHLGGFATQEPLLTEVISAAEKGIIRKNIPLPPNDWPRPDKTISLPEYMRLGDANGSSILYDAGCLKKQIELLYAHFSENQVRYAEVRCSPDNYKTDNKSALSILYDIIGHFERLMKEELDHRGHFCQINLIIIVTRKTDGDLSSISRHLALAITAAQINSVEPVCCKVVGVDLAGFENKDTRPAYFANDFIGIHRNGIAVTAHAGENDDAESIWQAVHQLHARRIGHALNLYQAKDLKRTIAERRIGIEMCPYANYQIKGYKPMKGVDYVYPLEDYLKAGILVTVNTDNIGISGADINDNFLLLADMNPNLSRMQMLMLIRNALEVAFIGPGERERLISSFDKQVYQACVNSKNND